MALGWQWIIGILTVLAVAGQALGQTGALSHSPAEVVERYLLLDSKGARLESISHEALSPYVSWKEEPVWGQVVVISDYRVPEDYKEWELVSMLEVVIPVQMAVLGSVYFDTAGFVPDATQKEVRFRVKAINNRWRIVEPILPPHVKQKRMVNFVRQAQLDEKEPMRRSTLTVLEEDLRKAR